MIKKIQFSALTDLDSHVGRSSADESKRCSYVDPNNDIPRIVGCSMKHSIESEPSIVHDVIEFSIFPISPHRGL